jgi:uncharacterized membrane protein YbhN (UPF0104 family)
LRDQLPSWLLGSYLAGVVLLLGFGAGLVLAPPLLNWLRRLSQHRYWQLALDFVAHFVAGLRTLFRQPATALMVIVESLVIWLCDALVLWLVVLSLAAPLSLPAAAFVALTVDVLAAVPLTPGGVGQIDAAYAALLALLALPAQDVGTIVLVVRFITYWSFLVFSGLVTLAAGFGGLMSTALASGARDIGAQATGADPGNTSTPVPNAGEDACAPSA